MNYLFAIKTWFNKYLNLSNKCLYQNQSDPNGPIFVYENKAFRWLCFDNKNIQTLININSPWQPYMCYIKPFCFLLNNSVNTNCLLLGSGGGAVIHYVKHHFPKATIKGIENHPLVYQVAQDYFFISKEDMLVMDASLYIQTTTKIFDYILVDVYSNKMTPHYQDLSFITQCKNKASRGVSFNLLGNRKSIFQAIASIRKVYKNNTLCFFSKNNANVIIHAFNKDFTKMMKKIDIACLSFDSEIGLYSQYPGFEAYIAKS